MVTIEDLSQANRSVSQKIAPAVRQLSQDLSRVELDDIEDHELFLDMARQVKVLERFCRSIEDGGSAPS
jgi:hypothetical protein